MVEGSDFARTDPYRAATSNKVPIGYARPGTASGRPSNFLGLYYVVCLHVCVHARTLRWLGGADLIECERTHRGSSTASTRPQWPSGRTGVRSRQTIPPLYSLVIATKASG
jgi:hypothetical protein